jgi:hypothetical protein
MKRWWKKERRPTKKGKEQSNRTHKAEISKRTDMKKIA